jgi:hypothetical protein
MCSAVLDAPADGPSSRSRWRHSLAAGATAAAACVAEKWAVEASGVSLGFAVGLARIAVDTQLSTVDAGSSAESQRSRRQLDADYFG